MISFVLTLVSELLMSLGIILEIIIDLLAFFHKWRSVIAYSTHYLFCDSIAVYLVNKMTAAAWRV